MTDPVSSPEHRRPDVQILDVTPGALLGADGVESPVTEAELTLVRVIRELSLSPETVIAQLVASPVREPVS